jgi:mannose-6-phosphate isomerase-like protein (cupin superfamily)
MTIEPTAETPKWAHNPATGEMARIITEPADELRSLIEVELFLQPGAAVAGAHHHPTLVERFEVVEGEVSFLVGDRERTMGPGDGISEVPAGTVHDWWNSGSGIARVEAAAEVARGAPADSAERFIGVIEVLWSLGARGEVGDDGRPDPLWLAAIGHEYRDVIRFEQPPAAVQSVLFPLLAVAARLSGRRHADPALHGPSAAMYIEDPGDELDAILNRSVDTRAVRGRGSS